VKGTGSTAAAVAVRGSEAFGTKPTLADAPPVPDGALTAPERTAVAATATAALGSSASAAAKLAAARAGVCTTGSVAAAAVRTPYPGQDATEEDSLAERTAWLRGTRHLADTETREGPAGVRIQGQGGPEQTARWRERWASYRPLVSFHEEEAARSRAAVEALGGTWAPPLNSLRVCEEAAHAEERGFGAAPAAASPAGSGVAVSAAAAPPLTALGAQLQASGVTATPLHLSVPMPYYVVVPAGWTDGVGDAAGGLARGVGAGAGDAARPCAGTGASGAGAGCSAGARAESNAPELGPASGGTACGTEAVPAAQLAPIDALNAEMQRRYAAALAIMFAPLPAAALPVARTLAAGSLASDASGAARGSAGGSVSGAGRASLPIPVPIPTLYPVPLHLQRAP
jgi:hypothetical protein